MRRIVPGRILPRKILPCQRSKPPVILSEAKDLRPNPHRNRSVVDCTGAAPLRPMPAKIPASRPSCLYELYALCGEPLLKPRNENQP